MLSALIEIAVPTYNGSGTIAEAIHSLLKFIGDNPVRIRVYDNASNDNTVELISVLGQADDRVSISTFDENLGFDGNVRRCIANAEADYVWLFSDDDIAPTNGFERFLSYLRDERPKILYFNHFAFYHNDLKQAGVVKFKESDQRYTSGIDFFYKSDLGFISSQVLQRIPAQHYERAILNSSGHAHLDIAARIALQDPGLFVLMGSCGIAARTLELPRYNSVKQGFMAKALLFKRLYEESIFKESEFRLFIQQLVSGYFVYTVLKDRAYKITPKRELNATLVEFSDLGSISSRYFFLARLAAWFPSFWAKLVVRAYYWKRSLKMKTFSGE
jgi:glycosyltransferase involved in cell wall biosynthesis